MRAVALAAAAVVGISAGARADAPLKLGVLTDMTGIYSDLTGKGSVAAVQMAVEECRRGPCAGMDIRVVSADHQNKPDVGTNIAREWMDREGVEVLIDMSNAALQLAIPPLVAERNRMAIFAGGTARLTGDACQPEHLVQWMWDTYVQVSSLAGRLTKPGTKWYLVTADYALGAQLEADAKSIVTAKGGTYLGSVRHPFPSTDLSSFILTAQGSGANVIAFANAGGDTVNGIKTAHEFGLPSATQQLVAFFLTANDVRGLGLPVAQGTTNAEGFWWDLDERTRAFAERFRAATGGKMPSAIQAGLYSATLHYLKAVAASGSRDTKTVLARMRALPIDDDVVRNAHLRLDGRMVHDYYVFQVKTPAESHGEYDVYKLIATIPGNQAFRPMSAALCPRLPE
jgi:branched-chain amino acid transport system substrate-binding protein